MERGNYPDYVEISDSARYSPKWVKIFFKGAFVSIICPSGKLNVIHKKCYSFQDGISVKLVCTIGQIIVT